MIVVCYFFPIFALNKKMKGYESSIQTRKRIEYIGMRVDD